MGQKIDLTGKKFGHLTVLRDTGERKNRQVVWECECDCDAHTHVNVVGGALRSNHTTSCGCSRKGKNIKDISNQRFGQLTVLKLDYVDDDRKAHWICKCDCGEIFSTLGTDLRAGKVTKCRKCTDYKTSYEKIINHKFGRLTPLYPTEERNNAGRIYWICKCDCGNEIKVTSSSLLSGNTQSCGCLRGTSIGEKQIETLLRKNNIPYLKEYTFPDLKSPKNGVLRYDFALLKNNQVYKLIEFDGVQHFKPNEYWGGEESFKYLQLCDQLKNDYAKQHNIVLVRLPYTKKDNIELSDILGHNYEI